MFASCLQETSDRRRQYMVDFFFWPCSSWRFPPRQSTLFLQKTLAYAVAYNRTVPVSSSSCVTYNVR